MATQLPDKAGRMPGGPAAELPLLQQDHVGPAELREMIGDRAAYDAAADDDDPRLCWKFLRHEPTSQWTGVSIVTES